MTTLVLLAAFPLLVLMAAICDLCTMTIPNRISLALALVFGVCALVAGLPGQQILLHLAGALLVFTAGFALFALGWMGGGDVKLAAAITLWLGFDHVVEYLLLAAIAGGILTFAILTLRILPLPSFALGWTWLTRLHDRRTGVPYGVALAAAALMIFPGSVLWQSSL